MLNNCIAGIAQLAKFFGILLLINVLVACGGGVTGDAENFIVVDDQVLVSLDEITIARASLKSYAWIVIYEADQLGSKSEVILGKKPLAAENHEKIKISLNREILDHEILYAELRKDAGMIGVYEPATVDTVISQSAVTAISFTVSKSNVPFLSVDNQQIFQNSVTVSKVVIDQNSWLVLHRFDENANHKLGTVLGYQNIAGNSTNSPQHNSNTKIGLSSSQLSSGDVLLIALYRNAIITDGDVFDALEDSLILYDGSPIIAQFTLISEDSLAECNNCQKFELTANISATAYLWSKIDLQTGAKFSLGANSDLELRIGETYQIINQVKTSHPFDFLDSNGAVLLSQTQIVPGSFENNSEVGWAVVNGIMTFTLTAGLAEKLKAYRCAYHPDAMKGNVIVKP